MTNDKWDDRFIKLAEHISTWSKDPSTKTGAVIVDVDNRVVSVGYNGLPKGVEDTADRLDNREQKYKMVVHCEVNAVLFARSSLAGCRLYTWPFMSCSRCAAVVIQSGIKEVIAPALTHPRWEEECRLAQEMFAEAAVVVREARGYQK